MVGTCRRRSSGVAVLLLLICFHPFTSFAAFSRRSLAHSLQELALELRTRRAELLERYPVQGDGEEVEEYANEWVAEVRGDRSLAEQLAHQNGYEFMGQMLGSDNHYIFRRRTSGSESGEKSKRELPHHTKRLAEDEKVSWVEQQKVKRRVKRDGINFNDELWSKQWYLHDTRTSKDLPKLDLHVIGAWQLGYTGKGVVVSILDDGIQHDHPDLAANYDPMASYDLNDNDTNPMPTMDDYNKHGTRCAGEVAMVANNHVCGVGVAFNAKIGGIRMLDGRITDRLEAEALQFHIDHVDVFSASWGPNDDGKTVEGPGTLAEKSLVNGIKNGRGGKGTIYVWASGNGGTYQDNCDCDGYTDSVYTLSISSASQSGKFPWYGEKCSSTLATTYSSGAYTDQKITTTDLKDECTTEHTGTSAAAPLAAGIVALGLEANPALTWRDIQHLTIWTSEPAPLLDNKGWHKNARGLYVNTRFGYGLMNAKEFAKTAKDWTLVPTQRICTTTFPSFKEKTFKAGKAGQVSFSSDACRGQENEIRYLEHVQLVTDLTYTRRGNLALYLTSPNGTRTKLLSPRNRDNSKAGFRKWPFMSVHTWGEDPSGWWKLEALDTESQNGGDFGTIDNITLILYGTKEKPEHYKKGRQYNMDYNRVHDRALHDRENIAVQKAAHGYGREVIERARKVGSALEVGVHHERIHRALQLIEDSLGVEEERRRRALDATPHVYQDSFSR